MKITLLTSRAGADFSQHVGDVIDVPAAEALRMIEAGQATALEAASKPANASKKQPAKETR